MAWMYRYCHASNVTKERPVTVTAAAGLKIAIAARLRFKIEAQLSRSPAIGRGCKKAVQICAPVHHRTDIGD
jgi:hypothetical protein